MRRRDFITLAGGTAAAWPLTARAQQAGTVRRIGFLLFIGANDSETKPRIAAFVQGLEQLGWGEGRNIRIDYRLGEGDADVLRRQAAELAALAPDVILAIGSSARADSFCDCSGSCWLRHRQESVEARRQCHGVYAVRIRFERKMA